MKELGHLPDFVFELFFLADYLYIRLLGPEDSPFEFLGILVFALSMSSGQKGQSERGLQAEPELLRDYRIDTFAPIDSSLDVS